MISIPRPVSFLMLYFALILWLDIIQYTIPMAERGKIMVYLDLSQFNVLILWLDVKADRFFSPITLQMTEHYWSPTTASTMSNEDSSSKTFQRTISAQVGCLAVGDGYSGLCATPNPCRFNIGCFNELPVGILLKMKKTTGFLFWFKSNWIVYCIRFVIRIVSVSSGLQL